MFVLMISLDNMLNILVLELHIRDGTDHFKIPDLVVIRDLETQQRAG